MVLEALTKKFIERFHQEGLKSKQRFNAIWDANKKYIHFLKWMHVKHHPKVTQICVDIQNKRHRKQTNETNHKRDLAAKT